MHKVRLENIIIIILGIILITIIGIVAYINSIAREKNKEAIKEQAKLVEQTGTQTKNDVPASRAPIAPESNPPVQLDALSEYKLLSKIKNRTPLKEEDKVVVKEIKFQIEPEDAEVGTVYESPFISIWYVGEADIFQVEIKSGNINTAKNEAVSWFLNQGLSRKAICDYPVYFYLNPDFAESLRGTDTVMNTLPPGC